MFKNSGVFSPVKKLAVSFLVYVLVSAQVVTALPPLGVTPTQSSAIEPMRSIAIPAELGAIEDSYVGPGGYSSTRPLVIHIKDAHTNYDAQKKIEHILGILHEKHGFRMIAVEGAAAPLDRRYLKFLKDEDRNRQVVDYLARKGEISGVDMFVLQASEAEAYGIEDIPTYAENLSSFRRVAGSRDEMSRMMEYLEGQVELVMPRLMDKDLLKVARLWAGFEVRQSELLSYVKMLARESEKWLDIDLGKIESQIEWPHLWRILKLHEIEGQLLPKAIQADQDRLLSFLREKGVEESLMSRLEKVLLASGTQKQENLTDTAGESPRILHERIYDGGVRHGLDWKLYPHYSTYLQYLVLQSEIEGGVLFEEMRRLSDHLLVSLADEREEQEIIALLRDLKLVKKAYALELMRDEVAEFRKRQPELAPGVMLDRLMRLKEAARVNNHKAELDSLAEQLDTLMPEIVRFYELAEKRDAILVKNMLARVRDANESQVVLVTGGYHTEGIKERLRDLGISYLVIAPRITEIDKASPYVDIMMNRMPKGSDTDQVATDDFAQPANIYGSLQGDQAQTALERRPVVVAGAVRAVVGNLSTPDATYLLAHPVFSEPEVEYGPVYYNAASLGAQDLGRRLSVIDESLDREPADVWRERWEGLLLELGLPTDRVPDADELASFAGRVSAGGYADEAVRVLDKALLKLASEKEPPLEDTARRIEIYSAALGPLTIRRLGELREYLGGRIEELEKIPAGQVPPEPARVLVDLVGNPALIPQSPPVLRVFVRRLAEEPFRDIRDQLRRLFERVPTPPEPKITGGQPPVPPDLIPRINLLRRFLGTRPARPLPPPDFGRLIDRAVAGLTQQPPDFEPARALVREPALFTPEGRPTPEAPRLIRDQGVLPQLQRLLDRAERLAQRVLPPARPGEEPLPDVPPFLPSIIIPFRQLVQASAPPGEPLPLPTLINRVGEVFPARGADVLPILLVLAELITNPQIITQDFRPRPDLSRVLQESGATEPFRRIIIDIVALVRDPNVALRIPATIPAPIGPISRERLFEVLDLIELALADIPEVPPTVPVTPDLIQQVIPSLTPAPGQSVDFEALISLLTNPTIARVDLTLQPEFGRAIPPELVRLFQQLIPPAIQALRSPDTPPTFPSPSALITVPVTPVRLIELLNQIEDRIRTVTVESLRPVVELATRPDIVRPDLTLQPNVPGALASEVVEALREQIPPAAEALRLLEPTRELEGASPLVTVPVTAERLTEVLNGFAVELIRPVVGIVTSPDIVTPDLTVQPNLLQPLPAEVVETLRNEIPPTVEILRRLQPTGRIEGVNAAITVPVTVERLVVLLSELAARVSPVTVERVVQAQAVLVERPATVEGIRPLVELVTNPNIVRADLTLVPNLGVTLPPEIVTAFRTLIPQAIEAVRQLERTTRLEGVSPLVTVPVTAERLTELLNGFAVELIRPVVGIVTSPDIVTPDLTVQPNLLQPLPAEVVETLRNEIPPTVEILRRLQPTGRIEGVNAAITVPVTVERLVVLLSELAARVSPVTVERVVQAQAVLVERPATVEGIRPLVELVTNPNIVRADLTLVPNLGVTLPPEIVTAFRTLIPAAIRALGEIEPTARLEGASPLVTVAITPAALIQILRGIEEQVPLNFATIEPLIEQLVRLVQGTAIPQPGLETRVLGPSAELAAILGVVEGVARFESNAVLPLQRTGRLEAVQTALAASLGALTAAPPGTLPESVTTSVGPITRTEVIETLRRLEVVTRQPVGPQDIAQIVATIQERVSLVPGIVVEIEIGISRIPSAAVVPRVESASLEPVQGAVQRLDANIEEIRRGFQELSRLPGLQPQAIRGIERVIEALGAFPPSRFGIPGQPTSPIGLINFQRAIVLENIQGIPPALALIPPIIQQISQGIPAVSGIPPFRVPEIKVNNITVDTPELFPTERFAALRQVAQAFQEAERLLEARDVSLEAVLAVADVVESVEAALPEALRQLFLELAFPELPIVGEGGLFAPALLTAPPSEFHQIVRQVYENFYVLNTTDAGAVFYDFRSRIPTRRELLGILGPQTFNTKSYVRIVLHEGVDEERVNAMREWARDIVDAEGNRLGDTERFDFVIVPEREAVKRIAGLHKDRRAGVDERSVYEWLRFSSPAIESESDFFEHAVYFADESVLRELDKLPEGPWLVYYPASVRRVLQTLPYMSLRLLRAALIRNQLAESEKRELVPQKNGLRPFLPNAQALAQFLSTWVRNRLRLLAAA